MTGVSLEDAVRIVTTTNPTFAVGEADIRGVTYPVFKNIPAHTRGLLQAACDVQPADETYLVYRDQRWSYDDFTHEINRMAHVLCDRFGVVKGQPVALAMQNCPEMLTLMMAITSVGGVVVFLNAWWTSEELDYAVRDSGAKLIFADRTRAARLAPLETALELQVVGVRDAETPVTYQKVLSPSVDVSWPGQAIETDDDMAIMYSSGTTGHPKGVVQTHRGAMNAVYTWLMQVDLAAVMDPPEAHAPPPPRPAFLVITPLFHVTATHPVFLLSLPAGAKLVLMDKWDVEEAVTLIEREQITRILGVPTQSADLFETAQRMGKSLDSLEFLGSGGAKRPAAQVGALAQAFPKAMIATGWGMTETNANGIGMAGPASVAQPGVAGRL
ncbi:MAG: AMP-binding protein [Arenibacterium sp.]